MVYHETRRVDNTGKYCGLRYDHDYVLFISIIIIDNINVLVISIFFIQKYNY